MEESPVSRNKGCSLLASASEDSGLLYPKPGLSGGQGSFTQQEPDTISISNIRERNEHELGNPSTEKGVQDVTKG